MANMFIQTLPRAQRTQGIESFYFIVCLLSLSTSLGQTSTWIHLTRDVYICICITILINPCYNFDNSIQLLTIPGYNCDNSCAKPDTPLRYKQSRLNMGENNSFKFSVNASLKKSIVPTNSLFVSFCPTMILKSMFVPWLPISWKRQSSLSLFIVIK